MDASMGTLYVRVVKGRETPFFRAAMQFTAEWRQVEVDIATARILLAEQMLQVSGTVPEDFKPVVAAVAVEVPIASALAENTPPEAKDEAAEAVDEAAASADSAEKSQGA